MEGAVAVDQLARTGDHLVRYPSVLRTTDPHYRLFAEGSSQMTTTANEPARPITPTSRPGPVIAADIRIPSRPSTWPQPPNPLSHTTSCWRSLPTAGGPGVGRMPSPCGTAGTRPTDPAT